MLAAWSPDPAQQQRGNKEDDEKKKKKERFAFFLQFLLVFAFAGTEVVVQLTPSAGDFAFATPCPTAAEFSGDHTAFALLQGQSDLRGHKKRTPNENFRCLKQ